MEVEVVEMLQGTAKVFIKNSWMDSEKSRDK